MGRSSLKGLWTWFLSYAGYKTWCSLSTLVPWRLQRCLRSLQSTKDCRIERDSACIQNDLSLVVKIWAKEVLRSNSDIVKCKESWKHVWCSQRKWRFLPQQERFRAGIYRKDLFLHGKFWCPKCLSMAFCKRMQGCLKIARTHTVRNDLMSSADVPTAWMSLMILQLTNMLKKSR